MGSRRCNSLDKSLLAQHLPSVCLPVSTLRPNSLVSQDASHPRANSPLWDVDFEAQSGEVTPEPHGRAVICSRSHGGRGGGAETHSGFWGTTVSLQMPSSCSCSGRTSAPASSAGSFSHPPPLGFPELLPVVRHAALPQGW